MMSNQAWETLSNQAVAAAGAVYFLALLAFLVQWAAGRAAAPARTAAEPAAVGAGGDARTGPAEGPAADEPALAPRPGQEPAGSRAALFGRLGLLLTGLACAVHLAALVARGMSAEPNRVPWGNMYEFTISGTFVVAFLYLLSCRRLQLGWMGPLVVGFVVSVLMVAVIWLYEPMTPLPEALKSPWLVIHVVSAVIATGAFTLGGIASLMLVVRDWSDNRGRATRLPGVADLDRVSYRMHAFGFPVWTFAALITGPIWAHQAWASYWNWDPKEVWAFITWVVYAAYLHARATAGWKGRRAALLALLGLATLWYNFIGVNFFASNSQHSYAAPVPGAAAVPDTRAAAAAPPAGQPAPVQHAGAARTGSEAAEEVRVVVRADGTLTRGTARPLVRGR